MRGEAQKISRWRVAVVFGAMLVLVLCVPSLPRKHHLVYWAVAFVVEAGVCAWLLPFRSRNAG
jgi:hypothetical protein